MQQTFSQCEARKCSRRKHHQIPWGRSANLPKRSSCSPVATGNEQQKVHVTSHATTRRVHHRAFTDPGVTLLISAASADCRSLGFSHSRKPPNFNACRSHVLGWVPFHCHSYLPFDQLFLHRGRAPDARWSSSLLGASTYFPIWPFRGP